MDVGACVKRAEAEEEVVSLCQHVVENEEVEGTVDGGARVVADGGIYIGEWVINIRGRRRNQGSETASKGHRIVSFLKFRAGYL